MMKRVRVLVRAPVQVAVLDQEVDLDQARLLMHHLRVEKKKNDMKKKKEKEKKFLNENEMNLRIRV